MTDADTDWHKAYGMPYALVEGVRVSGTVLCFPRMHACVGFNGERIKIMETRGARAAALAAAGDGRGRRDGQGATHGSYQRVEIDRNAAFRSSGNDHFGTDFPFLNTTIAVSGRAAWPRQPAFRNRSRA